MPFCFYCSCGALKQSADSCKLWFCFHIAFFFFPLLLVFNLFLHLPCHLISCRFFISILQHRVLTAFRKVLISSPALLEVFRKEGIWDLIFSENFFYFGSASEELSEELTLYLEGSPGRLEKYFASGSNAVQLKFGGIEIIQIEAISFVELAATSNGSVHNLVCSCHI